jgi:hypothetical protein
VVDRERLLDGEAGESGDVAQARRSLCGLDQQLDSYGSPVSEQDDRILRLASAA